MHRRSFLGTALALLPAASARGRSAALPEGEATLPQVLDRAEALLETVLVAKDGVILAERGYRGRSVSAPTNIKSASKSVISALVGIAIDKGLLEGPDQKIAPLLSSALPPDPDPRLREITVGHLLSMQAGLERTSGVNYGRWIASRDWVRAALAQPFVDEPGGSMLYSTGSTHLLSAILTRVSRRSTLALAREWLGPVPGFAISDWDRDPQGIYLGGNQMAMSPRSLLAFGELYRRGGRTPNGRQVVPEGWVALSWQPHTESRFTGDAYGYGWFLRRMGGQDVRYAWGYGGQMLYVMPALGLTVVMTSDDQQPSARTGYRDELHDLLASIVVAVSQTPAD
jgi:CubicO group peptidase (beta-lactamase class C family)